MTNNKPRSDSGQQLLEVGRLTGVFGIRGWLKVNSYMTPAENILSHKHWVISKAGRQQDVNLQQGKPHGKGLVVKLGGVDDRDMAAELVGNSVWLDRNSLPEAEPDEYYWADLVGLGVETTEGVKLGTVDHLLETGANDVLVVRGDRERLIPFLQPDVIVKVDLPGRLMTVDWDPEF